MSNLLSLTRIVSLIKHDIWVRRKNILITALTIIALLALIPSHVTGSGAIYFNLLYIGGFVITSLAFKELSNPQRCAFYLMIPASNVDRFVSKWFSTSVGYAAALLILYSTFALLSVLVNQLVFAQSIPMFNPLEASVWLGICKYVILQSVVLLGAITFKKNVLIKTALTLCALLVFFSAASVLFVWVFCPDCLIGGFTRLAMSSFYGGNFLFWVVLAPFCWFITYLKLTEIELR